MPMKKSHFTEEQIAYALRQAETGTAVTEGCRAMGVSEQTYYRWKKQYGGLGVQEIRRGVHPNFPPFIGRDRGCFEGPPILHPVGE